MGIYTLRDAWHQVIEDAIRSNGDDEIIASIKLIAR